MKPQDREYIEERLLAPVLPLAEAVERLFEVKEDETAERLYEAANTVDEVRQQIREETP